MSKFCLPLFIFLLCIVSCNDTATTNMPPTDDNNNDTTNTGSGSWEKQPNATTVDLSAQKQLIRGFGAANIVGWRPDMTSEEINKAFGTGEGQLGFSILRLRIPANQNGWSAYVPTARKAYAMGVKIIASPWSPPAGMKTNNNTTGGRLKGNAYGDYADHLKAFVDFMANHDVPLYAVSVQNEPDIQVNYESCDWTPNQMLRFVKEYGDSVGTRLMAPESFQFRRPMSDPLLNDSTAAAHLDIIGGHIYGGGLASYPLAEKKGKELWMSEHYTESDHSGNDWPLALDVATEMHSVLQANMSAYVWWYIVRFYGPIGDGEKGTQKGKITKRGYVMSQFSRFIRPGFHRIDADSNPQSDIYIGAYRSDDQLVITAINMSNTTKSQQFIFENGDRIDSLIPYVTSSTKNVSKQEAISVNEDHASFTYNVPAQSIVTFVEE